MDQSPSENDVSAKIIGKGQIELETRIPNRKCSTSRRYET
jgi:hypothetical protein